MEEQEQEPSYIDYETFLDPSFSPSAFANTLVLATNNATDSPLDLTTPLSRVLFDVQEVDTHLDKLTSTNALALLSYTTENVQSSEKILQELEGQVAALTTSYERLEKEVIARHTAADEVRIAAERVWETVKLGRAVSRCLTLGRQLEAQMSDLKGSGAVAGSDKKDDHHAMVRAANTILGLRQVFNTQHPGGDAEGMEDINVIKALRTELVYPSERSLISRAEQVVGQFSMSSLTASSADSATTSTSATFAQTEDTKSRATSALTTLYLLSPVSSRAAHGPFEPSYLISALQDYLRRAITSSLAGLTTALSTLPKLERTLIEISARCQNIVALEMLLESLKPPPHPLLPAPAASLAAPLDQQSSDEQKQETPQQQQPRQPQNLLQPLLTSLDTSSLPSYFWRSMASQMTSRVQKILKDGGVSARTLRTNKDRVRDALRQCVNRGSQLPAATSSLARGKATAASAAAAAGGGAQETVGNWEREAAVMVGSVVNMLGR